MQTWITELDLSNSCGLCKIATSIRTITGTVTAGNASQTTDGAATMIIMRESKAKPWS